MPLLSIVTTVYDRADCLASCVRSVSNLDWQDYEHIVVADHPPEDSFEELRRVVAETGDARISLHNLPDRTNDFGISPAQFGMQRAQGKYLAFLDDDNAYLPEHFNALIDCLETNPALGLAFSACLWNAELLLNTPTPALGRIDLGQVLFRRELLGAHLNDTLNYSGYEWDWQLIADLLSRGVAYRFIDQETFIFRLDKYPNLRPEAPLESARKRIDQLVRELQYARREFAEARREAQEEYARVERERCVILEMSGQREDQMLTQRLAAERLDQELERLGQELEHSKQELERSKQELERSKQELERLGQELERSREETLQITRSRSWRVTAPLRKIAAQLRPRVLAQR
jgi:hypothetical protein